MYSATNMLSKARSNPVYGEIQDKSNRRNYYRNAYLKSEHWINLRKEKLEKNPICEICKTGLSLDVHHKEYKGLYDVSIQDLQTLCRVCHNKEHDKIKFKQNRKKNRHQKKRFSKDELYYNDLWDIFNCKKPNFALIYWILSYIINHIDTSLRPAHLSKFRGKHQKKFDKNFNFPLKEISNYISIHY